MIEHQAVLAPAREVVQADAQVLQHALVGRDGGGLARRDQALLGELGPGLPEARGAREPQHHLQVAQSPGAFLDVGLEVVGRLLEALVAALLLPELGLEEVAHRAARAQPLVQGGEEPRIARNQARLEETRVHGDVLGSLLDAFGDGAHAVAGLEAAVPQLADEALDRGVGRAPVGQEHEDIHVRMREESAPPIAPDRHQRDMRIVDRIAPQAPQQLIGNRRVRGECRVCVGLAQVFAVQRLALRADPCAQLGGPGARAGLDDGRAHETRFVACCSMKAGGAGVPAETVSTSKESAVTSTVCSHCADSE